MSTLNAPMLKAAMVSGVGALSQTLSWGRRPSLRKAGLILGTLTVAGLATAILFQIAGGDWGIMRHRLTGEVKLSTGTHAARTLAELNQLSWNNGLDVLETLDNVNASVAVIAKGPAKAPAVNQANIALDRDMRRLKTLLKDRDRLLKSARAFRTSELYAPVYAEYLNDTMAKVATVSKPLAGTGTFTEQ